MDLGRWKGIVKRVTAVSTRIGERSGNSRVSVEGKSMPNMREITDVVMTGAGLFEYLFYKGEGRIKYKSKITSRHTW